MAEEMDVDSVLNLWDEFENRRQAAVQQLLALIKGAEEKLVRLGYPLDRGGRNAAPKAADLEVVVARRDSRMTKSAKALASTVCPVCGETGHDGRKHRWDRFRAEQAAKAGNGAKSVAEVAPAPKAAKHGRKPAKPGRKKKAA
jgi:hypothetical protein